MIDLVVVRAGQRICCKDVRVMRGADCWTDHMLVRAKLRIGFPPIHSRIDRKELPFSVHKLSSSASQDDYVKCLEDILQDQPYRSDLPTDDNWQVLKSCIVQAAEKMVGRSKRKQPEWFADNVDKLAPLIKKKNEALDKMLRTNLVGAKREFRRWQRRVKGAVDKARVDWILKVATEA